MIFINALIFKRYVELKKSKKLIILFLIPIVSFVFLCLNNRVSSDKSVFYFGMVMTFLSVFIHWNPENLIYSGYLLATPLTPKKIWINNALIITLSSYIYAYIVFLSSSIITNLFSENLFVITGNGVLGAVLNLPLTFALVLASTLYFVDYSTSKQYLQIPFGLICIVVCVVFFVFPNVLPFSLIIALISFLISILIIAFCLLINKNAKNESLFLNTKKLVDAYSSNIVDE